ncbi:MAG: ABC transporter permease [Deltaproteobacteria bacterium]|jgi:oligopeptide transport system permease protein|nr:ABC transporter permease [Deltaproteobacteria bacterium]MBW2533711.1 ABC transporter permease [Deltaproteobacteria bacterium]
MIRLLLRRLVGALAVIFVVATAAFFVVRLAPGGPFDRDRNMPAQVKENLERSFGLDRPLHEQYLGYLGGMARGDLGHSLKRPDRTVGEIIRTHLPYSIVVGVLALLLATLAGLALAVLAAVRRKSWIDHLCMAVGQIGLSVPTFVIGPLLILLVSLRLGWLPPAGAMGPSSYLLPALSLAAPITGVIARLARTSLVATLQEDYIRAARARGLSEAGVFIRALRTAIIPVLVWLGPAAAAVVTGSIVIESIFQIPGLGYYFVGSVTDRDHTVLAGILVCYCAILVSLNFVVDLARTLLDPRLREERR